MKVLAVNSSPKKDKGNTAIILNPFLDGMKHAGADVELYYTSDLDIKPCDGDFDCWTREGGKCGLEDDMVTLDPKVRAADVIVFASPVYCSGVNGPMQTLIDRTLPRVQPFFEIRNDHTRHPLQENVKKSKIVLVSTCGLWEKDNIDPLLVHIEAYCKNANAEFAGALIRPHAPALEMGIPFDDILEASRDSGRQLVANGKISPDTLNIVSREILPRDVYVQTVNQYFEDLLAKKETM
jgi:multimeric flavodoxin WrbA